ncbi:MAG: Holliday junction branch migration protein RuvA [Clostridia bacterium]|nr:Holliday junction branch migration protein RuvA [Clostridia bacterium]
MFYYLNGTLEIIDDTRVVVDCGGVGYLVYTGLHTRKQLKSGEKTKLYTYASIGEDKFDIYGFLTREELDLFCALLDVSGVGAKSAASLLSMSPDTVIRAIIAGDQKTIQKAQGIGAKASQRIILELKGKFKGYSFADSGEGELATPAFSQGSRFEEARDALTALGFGMQQAEAVLSRMDTESMPIEEIIKRSLKDLMR